MHKILVSACLLGAPVRYDGRSQGLDNGLLARWQAEGRLLALCPEVAGGLPVPRAAAEIQADGRVLTINGLDLTSAFTAGAEAALALCRQQGIRLALLKEGSPSCGANRVYDGRFCGVSQAGAGVTSRLLRQHGVQVFAETQLEALATVLQALRSP